MNMINSFLYPEAIFFDWDGTLVHTIPLLRKAHNHVRTSLGFPEWTESEFWENLKHSSRDIYPVLYKENTDRAFEILYAYINEHHLTGIQVKEGARDLLTHIQGLNIPMGVISNKKHEYLTKEIEHLQWNDFFGCTIGSGVLEKDKPDPEPLHHAFELCGVKKNDNNQQNTTIWYVGDTATDMMASTNAGCVSVLIATGNQQKELVSEFSPSIAVESCQDLLYLLQTEQKESLMQRTE